VQTLYDRDFRRGRRNRGRVTGAAHPGHPHPHPKPHPHPYPEGSCSRFEVQFSTATDFPALSALQMLSKYAVINAMGAGWGKWAGRKLRKACVTAI